MALVLRPWVLECLGDIRKAMVPQWYDNCMARSPLTGELNPLTALSAAQAAEVKRALIEEHLPGRLGQIEALLASPNGLTSANDSEAEGGGSGGGGEGEGGVGGGPFVCGNLLTIAAGPHPPHSVPVLATSSTTYIVYRCSPHHQPCT